MRKGSFYSLLKVFGRLRSPWIGLVGVSLLYLLKRRYVCLALDPTCACNLRCRMCYFSGKEHERPDLAQLSDEDYGAMADALFHRVLRLQIGCGAEPTLYRRLDQLVRVAKERGVPYVSMTTNGNLLTRRRLEDLAEAGLDELILSTHGLTKETYEYFMRHARFEVFTRLLDDIRETRKSRPGMRLRVNYTVNNDNVEELALLPEVFKDTRVDVLQVRPIQDLGDSDYRDFRLDKVLRSYDQVFGPLRAYCESHGTRLLMPSKDNIRALSDTTASREAKAPRRDVMEFVYVYGRPGHLWREDFDFHQETFETYCHKTGYFKALMGEIVPFLQRGGTRFHDTRPDSYTTQPLNYKVK